MGRLGQASRRNNKVKLSVSGGGNEITKNRRQSVKSREYNNAGGGSLSLSHFASFVPQDDPAEHRSKESLLANFWPSLKLPSSSERFLNGPIRSNPNFATPLTVFHALIVAFVGIVLFYGLVYRVYHAVLPHIPYWLRTSKLGGFRLRSVSVSRPHCHELWSNKAASKNQSHSNSSDHVGSNNDNGTESPMRNFIGINNGRSYKGGSFLRGGGRSLYYSLPPISSLFQKVILYDMALLWIN
jgi:hypothetical protein